MKLWRQSYDNPPPFVNYNDKGMAGHPRFDKLYESLAESEHKQMPRGESLKMVRERITPYWHEEVCKTLRNLKKQGKDGTVLYVAHEHVLRGMVQTLTGIDNTAILSLRIPNAAPFIFEFDENMQPIRNYYLDNENVSVTESTKKESKETVLKL